MSTGRIQMNAVILPNGKVLAKGGSVNNEAPDTPGKTADLYDPVTNTFSSGGHRRVLAALPLHGAAPSGRDRREHGQQPGARGSYEAAIEIYTPAYLFDANDQLITTGRPSITGISPLPEPSATAQPFSVNYTSSSPISLGRAGASRLRHPRLRHGAAADRAVRPVAAAAVHRRGGTLNLTSPPNGNIAPPGYYMLFLLDSAGVPSKAQFIQLSPFAGPPPDGAIASPATDVTIPAGGSVSFGTSDQRREVLLGLPRGIAGDLDRADARERHLQHARGPTRPR